VQSHLATPPGAHPGFHSRPLAEEAELKTKKPGDRQKEKIMKMKFDSAHARALLSPHMGKPVVAKLLAAADRDWSGDIGCALLDAADGNLGAYAYAFARALPEKFGYRPMTAEEEAVEEAEAQEMASRAAERESAEKEARYQASRHPLHGGSSADAGSPGNEDAAWGSSSSEGWLVD